MLLKLMQQNNVQFKINVMKNMTIIYFLKFAIYGGIATYDYSIGSKYMVAWLLLAWFMFALAIIHELKPNKRSICI